jgi:hypothetical protein
MSERLLRALRRHPGRLFAGLLFGFAVLAACDAYYALTAHPYAPRLAPLMDLTGSRGLPALADVGLLLLAGLAAWHGLGGRTRVAGIAGRVASVLGLAALLIMLAALDFSRLKLAFAIDAVLLAPVGGVIVLGMLRGSGWPLQARLYAVVGLLLLATNPLTDRLERQLAGNSAYYTFDQASQSYVFDQRAWHALWAVSRAQELSELVALACLSMALLYVATVPMRQPSIPAETQPTPGTALHTSAPSVKQQ